MTAPVRIQRKRTRGYDMQAESRAINGLPAVYVGRPSAFGNPFTAEKAVEIGFFCGVDADGMREFLTQCFRSWIGGSAKWWIGDESDAVRAKMLSRISELRGRNLACWCPPPTPGKPDHCHASVLLEIANR